MYKSGIVDIVILMNINIVKIFVVRINKVKGQQVQAIPAGFSLCAN